VTPGSNFPVDSPPPLRPQRALRLRAEQLGRALFEWLTGPLHPALREFIMFGLKEGWACLFGGAMMALIILTKLFWPADAQLHRYDALFLSAIVLQVGFLAFRLETPREALVILIFHVVGTAMELFKTSAGSWTYPEEAIFRIGGVPLFSGFLYASVGSYMARIMRVLHLRFSRYPPLSQTVLLAVLIYANFFLHHFMPDLRLFLFVGAVLLWGRCWVEFTVDRTPRRMPLLLGFALIALFIYIAENLGTLTFTWVYPNQLNGWQPVGIGKYGSWFLLMLISFVLVTLVHRPALSESTR
jgi:uncharacterized membrane protein YoaT (DUF817 family)